MKLMQVSDPVAVLKLIREEYKALPEESITIELAGGRYLAKALKSPEDVPGFDRSTVDGYAVAARESFGASESIPAMFELAGEVLMGQKAPSIKPGQCCLVHTGGMLPENTDAVIMVEDTEVSGNLVNSFKQVAPGENVIHQGEDLKAGALALEAGQLLRAPEIGMLASIGITEVAVHRQPQIGFFSSGDELVPYSSMQLKAGQIRDSNAPAISYLASQFGAGFRYGGILPDNFEVFMEKSRAMLAAVDFLVFSGGSSVGSRDYTARTMQELGKPGLLVEGIAIQPGKPTLLANCNHKPVLGLPGHPVSALNIFSIFGRAIIDQLAGRLQEKLMPSLNASLTRNVASRTGRTDYVRVKLARDLFSGESSAVPVFGRSGMLRTLAEADGLLVVPPEKEGLLAGEKVQVYLWE
ncbi:MAG: molybdopterin molybdotransferase MoeA [Firmicutes bacterium]|nr:molybdopterin molybdotransferase MoeA [Bacillota bacterium]